MKKISILILSLFISQLCLSQMLLHNDSNVEAPITQTTSSFKYTASDPPPVYEKKVYNIYLIK